MLPVIKVTGCYLPDVWEKAVLAVLTQGIIVNTEYGGSTLDSTLITEITSPNLLYIHKYIPAGIEDLEKYRQSVLYGTEDYLIGKGGRNYTYHQRLFREGQVEFIIDKLVNTPYSRRAQLSTWIPKVDNKTDSPSCLQLINFRLLFDIEHNVYKLETNIYWRSRDVCKAWYMNMYALISLIENIALQLKDKMNAPVVIGRIVDICSSGHIYENDISFLHLRKNKMETSHWSERVFFIDDIVDIIKETQDLPGMSKDNYWEKDDSISLYNKQIVKLSVDIDKKVKFPKVVEGGYNE